MKKIFQLLFALALVVGMTSCTKTHMITVTSNNDSWGTVTGGGEYEDMAQVTLKATPASDDYYFEKWSDGTTDNPYVFAAISDASYEAIFCEIMRQYTITVTSNNTSWGTVSGGGTYDRGTKVKIEATPTSDHYVFQKWSDGNTENPRTITVTKDETYQAEFAQNGDLHTITVTSNNTSWGTVSGGGSYLAGTQVTIQATPTSNRYEFQKWSDGNTQNPRTITVTGDASYQAIFAERQNYCEVTFDDGTPWVAADIYTQPVTIDGIDYMYYACFKDFMDDEAPYVDGCMPTSQGTFTASNSNRYYFFYYRNKSDFVTEGGEEIPIWQPRTFSTQVTTYNTSNHTLSGTLTGTVRNRSNTSDIRNLNITFRNVKWTTSEEGEWVLQAQKGPKRAHHPQNIK